MRIQSKQQIKRKRIGKTGKIILSALAVTGSATLLVLMPGIAPGLKLALRIKNNLDESRAQQEMDRLVNMGYVNKHKRRSGDTYEISEKGHFTIATHRDLVPEKVSDKNNPTTWDRVWRIVIFDIDEERRSERDLFREAIHSYGFTYLQQSVWIYPYPCDDFIRLTKDYLGLENYVVYIKAEYIEGDAKMRRHFNLS